MRTTASSLVLGLLALTGVACGSSGGNPDAAQVAAAVGTVVDEALVTVGDEAQVVTLAPSQGRVEIEFLQNALKARTTVTVRAESRVPTRTGLAPARDVVLHVATQGLQFLPPARLRQALPPLPGNGSYVAISSPSKGTAWTTGPAAKLSRFAGAADAGAPDPTDTVWEIEVSGSGLWAIAVSEPGGGLDAAAPDSTPGPDAGSPPVADAGVDAPSAMDANMPPAVDTGVGLDASSLADRAADAPAVLDVGGAETPDARVDTPTASDVELPSALDGGSPGVPADASALAGTWKIVSSVCNGTPKAGVSGVTLTIAGATGYFTSSIGGTCVQTVPTTNSYPSLGRMDWSTGTPTCTGTSCPDQACSPPASDPIPHSAAVTISGSTVTVTEELTPPEEYGCPSGYQVTTLTR
jgi:hypothetical protein